MSVACLSEKTLPFPLILFYVASSVMILSQSKLILKNPNHILIGLYILQKCQYKLHSSKCMEKRKGTFFRTNIFLLLKYLKSLIIERDEKCINK